MQLKQAAKVWHLFNECTFSKLSAADSEHGEASMIMRGI